MGILLGRSQLTLEDAYSPERILEKLLADYVGLKLDPPRLLWEAVVIAVDTVGGLLQSDPPNPKNSIKARILSNGFDKYTPHEELTVFYPMFSHDLMPVKEGEYVIVMMEDMKVHQPKMYWISRIAEPSHLDSKNYIAGKTKVEEAAGTSIPDSEAQETFVKVPPIKIDNNVVLEDVPQFVARVGDRVLEGSNNAAIVVGRDRPNTLESGEKQQAGTIDIHAGRDATDPNFEKDKSRIYVSSRTDADGNFQLDVGPAGGIAASIVINSEQIRIISKAKGVGSPGIKVVCEGGDVHIEGSNIFLGKEAAEAVMQGDLFNTLWAKVMSALATHNHPSPVPNGPSPALASFSTPAMNDLSNPATGPVLSTTVKVKP